jgi:shikimate kinase/3-dehydroquinate synthase
VSAAAPPAALPHLVLGGFMGAGKSTIGRAVAAAQGVPFVDLDDAVLAAAPAAGATCNTIGELFAALGEPAFRRLEAGALARALAAPAPTVIAAGGGALVDPASRERALAAARVVTLTAPPATLLARCERPDQPHRPLLEGATGRESRALSLLAERAPVYAYAHATIASDAAPDVVAAAVLRAWTAPSVLVRLGARSYPVRFAGGADAGAIVADVLAALRPSAWLLVTDEIVEACWGAPFLNAAISGLGAAPAARVALVPGEREKNLAAVERVLAAFVAAGADRDAVVVAHGGGVVSDIAGFAAAVLLRGVRWISVPTTVLSMADAAIGGKTGVDLGAAKNAVGAFHQPSAVIIDPRRAATETDRAFASGLAEIVKAGAIADPELFAHLERHAPRPAVGGQSVPGDVQQSLPQGAEQSLPQGAEQSLPQGARRSFPRDRSVLEPALVRAAAVKAGVVSADERESGPRALLNFGHTLGHALEAAGAFERWTHGEAVSLGMVGALRAGRALGVTSEDAVTRVTALLAALGLPVKLSPADIEAALPYLSFDKKRRGRAVRAVFVTEVGQAVIREIPLDDLAQLYRGAADPA